jgi:hypothetical protein
MKKISLFLTMSLVVLSLGAFAQLKVTSNGYVGVITTAPAYKLDINSGESRSYYPGRDAFYINHWGNDPRLCSTYKIVFYKPDGTGFVDVECKTLYQYSDSTAKENIVPLADKKSITSGSIIAKIKQLEGINYNWKDDKNKKLQAGFLAQEIEKVIPEAVITNDSTKHKSLAYSAIIPYLVEAIKEQQVQIEKLESKLMGIEENNNNSLKSASLATGTTNNITENNAQLDQNMPNPFSKETKISCFIPDGANSSVLYIYNMQGTQLQQYSIKEKGKQAITIDGSSFIPGMYLYTLVIDGKEMDTKRMILTK